MARAPKAAPAAPGRTLLSLEQFASIEAWMEAYLRYALRPPGENQAPLLTDVYRKRQRAMHLLTGQMPPTDDEEAFHREIAELVAQAQSGRRLGSAQAKPIKLPKAAPAPAPDDDDPYDIG